MNDGEITAIKFQDSLIITVCMKGRFDINIGTCQYMGNESPNWQI